MLGGLKILQPLKGFRFNTDSLLLAVYLNARGHSYYEIGSGTGICSLVAASGHPDASFTAIEIQELYYLIAKMNAKINSISGLRFVNGDVRDPSARGGKKYDVVFANPPYRKSGHGRKSPCAHRNISIYDLYLPAEDLFSAAESLMEEDGVFCMINIAENSKEYERKAAMSGLHAAKQIIFRNDGVHKPVYTEFTRGACPKEVLEISEYDWRSSVDLLFKGNRSEI